ncbi:TetR/AcrR family transcriptional regulator [Pendulispora albinea]|uniref:TetR family transcriptional regulator n=1 Tax=Pendulispora albinea TaxID=2741071 RepID=A0ABZ2M6W0_9BACT
MPGEKLAEDERREQILNATWIVALRDGLERVTARRVATEAGTSPGLIYFHFGTMDDLLLVLLDRLLALAFDARETPKIAVLPTALERLSAMIEDEVRNILAQTRAIELFYAFWFGSRNPVFRHRIERALQRQQRAFEPVCAQALIELGHPKGVSASSLAATLVTFGQGLAFQLQRDPNGYNAAAIIAATRTLMMARAPSERPRAKSSPRRKSPVRKGGSMP